MDVFHFLTAAGVRHAAAAEAQQGDDGGSRRSSVHTRVPASGESATHPSASYIYIYIKK